MTPANPPVARDCGSGFSPLKFPSRSFSTLPIKLTFCLTFCVVVETVTSERVMFFTVIGFWDIVRDVEYGVVKFLKNPIPYSACLS